jgi:hypothetical protein
VKQVKVTKLEKQVLEAMAEGMYAEFGFSDYGLPELIDDTGLPAKVLRGVAGSLVKKELIFIDDREDEGYKNDTSMHIWYLFDGMEALVPEWKEEQELEEVQLVVE